MAQTIKIKRSATSGNKLTGSNSVTGEFGLNTADKSLYIQTGSTDASVVTVYDDSILHLDDTNNRVGIGTTSPTHHIHITGGITNGAIGFDASSVKIGTYSSIGYNRIFGTGSDLGLAINNGALRFLNQTTEFARFTSTGHLGIGTTSPYYKIDTRFNNTNTSLTNGSSGNWGSDGIRVENTSIAVGTMALAHFRTGDADWHVGGKRVGTNQANFIFSHEGSTKLTINSSGQLGVGVTDFTNALRGNGKQLIIGNCFVGTGAALVVDDFSRFAGAIYIHQDAAGSAVNHTSIDNNGSRLVITGKNGSTANALDAPDGFYVSGQQIVTSSRNLTNIGTITTSGNISINNNSAVLAARKIAARDTNGLAIATSDGTSRIDILNSGATRFNSTVQADYITSVTQTSSLLNLDDDSSGTGSNSVTLQSVSALNLKFDSNNNDTNALNVFSNGGTTPIFKIFDTGAVKFNNAFTFPTTDGSANQVLVTDGSGNVTWAAQAAASASTSISDADGDTKIQVEESADDDTIRFDTAGAQRMVIDETGKVGINAASLSKTLTVGGTFLATGEAFFSHFDNMSSASRMRDDLRLNFGTARTFAITGNSTNMHIKNGTTDVMTFDTSNRVGIGTTSPSQKLQVAGTILADTALAASSGTTAIGIGSESDITDTSSTYRIKLLSNSNNAKLTTYAYSSYLTLKAGVDGGGYANNWSKIELRDGGGTGSNNAHMKFYTHGDERMVIDNDGNVGIGTTSPSWDFVVSNAGAGGLEFGPDGIGAGTSFIQAYNRTSSTYDKLRYYASEHQFYIGGSNHALNINSNGNVGIGTNNPIQKLQVTGSIYANGGNIFIDSGNRLLWGNSQQFIEATNSGPMQFGTGNAERMRIDSNGNVGIGTTSPGQKLTVRGATELSVGDVSTGHATEFNWVKSNTGSSGDGVWYKVADISLPAAAYSAMSFEAYYETGLNNFGSHNYLDVREVFVSIVRNSSATLNNSPDSATLRGRTDDIRVYKTAAGTYELQARHNSENAKYAVRVRVFQTNGGTITPVMSGSTAGTTSGGTAYTVAEPVTTEGVRRYFADIDSSRIHLGSSDVYPSGNGLYVHYSGSGFIPSSTTPSSNASLGTSTYLWNGVFSRRFQGEVGTAGVPTFTFSEDSNTGMYDEWYDQSNSKRQLSFTVDGTRRMYLNEAGVWSSLNFYLPTGGSLRSFGTYTDITNGTSGNGFRMRNSADSVDSLIVTSAGNGTFAGSLTVNGDIDLNGSDINDINQINGMGGSGWLDFDMDTDSVYPESPTDNQTVLGSITHMNFVGDSNANGTGGNFYWGYGVDSTDSGTFTKTMSLNRNGILSLTGDLRGPSTFTIDPATHGDDTGTVVIAGNLQVDGTTTTINSTTLTVDDKNIVLASGSTNAAAANGAGLTVDCGSGTDATLTYDGTNDEWDFNKDVKVSGSVGVTNIVTNKVVKFNGTILDDSIITDNGTNVGIGQTNPTTRKLEIKHSANSITGILVENPSTGSGAYAGISFKNDSGGSVLPGLILNGSNQTAYAGGDSLNLYQYSSNPIGFVTNNSLRMMVSGAGNVGIGTDNPQQKLDVTSGHIQISNTSSTIGNLKFFRTSTNNGMEFRGYETLLTIHTLGGGVGEIARFERNTGNVGIGTNSPDTRLDVTTSGVNGLVLNSDTSATTNSARLFFKASGGTVGMLNVNNSLSFRTGMTINSTSGTERLNIDSTTIASTNTVLLKGANNNSAKADFALNTGGSPTVSLHGTQVQMGSSDMNWNGKISYVSGSGVYLSAWDNDLRLTTSGGASAGAKNIRFEPQASGGSSTLRMIINGGGNVGIGVTSPNAKLQVEELGIDTTTTSTSATTQVAIDTFAAATFRSARYTIQVTNSTDSTYHITEILLIHDGTTPQITEYGTIFTGSAEATFDADISSGNVRLLATPATTDSMTFKVVRHCITV